MTWPNDPSWKALADGARVEQGGKTVVLSVVDCGDLVAPVGRLVACDPCAGLQPVGNAYLPIPPGHYPVRVTLADMSGQQDGSDIVEAYATLVLREGPEATRRALTPLVDGDEAPDLGEGEFVGFGVDAGTACFVDEGALATGMPEDPADWYEVFDGDEGGAWFARMDDPNHFRPGLANVPLPLATDGANIVLIHSGWGDGVYPVVGGYDADGKLVRVHIDFGVVGPANA